MAEKKKNTRKTGNTKGGVEKESLEIKAENVTAVDGQGLEIPLTELEPSLAGEKVEVDISMEKEEKEKPAAGKQDETGAQPTAPIYQVLAPKDPTVKILYIDSCIPNNQIPIGNGRVITGSGKIFSVTLTEFEGVFMTPLVMELLRKRKFIVLEGLTEEQRRQYGVDYGEGEIIRNEGIFDWLLNCPVAEAAAKFGELCQSHREMVERRFCEAFEKGDNRLSRARVEALNEISKGDYEDGKGAFTNILKALNDAQI